MVQPTENSPRGPRTSERISSIMATTTIICPPPPPPAAGSEVCFCASFLAQTKKKRLAASGLTHKASVQISPRPRPGRSL
jgi:hypothetical protein